VIISATHEAHTSWTNRFFITLAAATFACLILYAIGRRQTSKERQEALALKKSLAKAAERDEEKRAEKERERAEKEQERERIAQIARDDINKHMAQIKKVRERRERDITELEQELAELKAAPSEGHSKHHCCGSRGKTK
jgi:hypothetical protein